MIREKQQREIVIDLTGADGNAFALMAHARNFAKQLGLNGDAIVKEMMSSDYETLIKVFDKNFGYIVTLER